MNATGIKVGDGDNTILNNGTLTVTGANKGTAMSTYPSAHLDNAFAYAGAEDTSLTSNAVGISAGDGVNTIENHKNIIVSSSVDAEARAYANTTTTTTHAKSYAGGNAQSTGIFVGNGQNIIKNYGDMTVSATADAYAKGDADEYGYAYIGYESVLAGSVPGIIAQAIGISAGYGINEIINYGTLEVNSTATANSLGVGDEATGAIANSYATATGIHTGDGMNIVSNVGTINVAADGKDASAIGIQTGDGDDTIANYGTISATNIKSGVSSLGVAIISGAGSDQVFLMNASESNGKINLGDGDDRLTLLGTPLVAGDVTGAVGIDTLIFDGSGSIDCNLMAFENAVKHGAGTYSVASLPTMERIEINQGTLQIDSSYAMADDSSFRTYMNGDGSHGQLNVNGKAQLNGELNMVKGQGVFRNGTLYDIILADEVEGIFSSETLPEDKPLLSFQTHTYSERVEVEALSKSFTTVAANSLQWTIAQHLDGVIPNATGDLSLVLGEFQALSEPEFNEAFAGLSPDTYNNSTRTTYDITRLYTESLHQRMHGLRSNLVSPSTVTQTRSNKNSILLAYNGPESSIGQLLSDKQRVEKQNRTGIWAQIFGQWGDQDEEDGFTGFDYSIGGITLGFDYLLTDSLIAGLSFDYADTNIDLDKDSGNGDIESLGGSIYGTYFNKHTYFEAALSYGRQSYDNNRNIVIGPLVRTAYSEHDGDVFSAFGAGGYNFQSKEWTIGPFGSLQYVYLDEDGFQEYGAGSISLRVDGRETESLVSNLGLRLARVFEFESGRLVPEVSLAWKYDFDIDDRNITTSFVGSPGASFTIEGQDIEDHSAKIGIGLTFVNNSNVSVSLNYNAELRKNYNSQGIIGYLRVTF